MLILTDFFAVDPIVVDIFWRIDPKIWVRFCVGPYILCWCSLAPSTSWEPQYTLSIHKYEQYGYLIFPISGLPEKRVSLLVMTRIETRWDCDLESVQNWIHNRCLFIVRGRPERLGDSGCKHDKVSHCRLEIAQPRGDTELSHSSFHVKPEFYPGILS